MNRLCIKTLQELPLVAEKFAKMVLPNHKHLSLKGEMGAGKTTFTAALCGVLGVRDEVTSPTFTIVNEYRTTEGKPIYHFDFYRISRLTEALDLGLYDYLDSGALCIMEWCENIAPLLQDDDVLEVAISVNPETLEREITW